MLKLIQSKDNPLHMSLFPPYSDSGIEFSFLLNSSLDVFEIRQKQTSIDQDLGLLHAVDERLASYGWLTTTGVKFLIIIDLIGEQTSSGIDDTHESAWSSFRESDLKPVCQMEPLIFFTQLPALFVWAIGLQHTNRRAL